MWKCEYCKTDNRTKDGHCIHCGSPRRNDNGFEQIPLTQEGTFMIRPVYPVPYYGRGRAGPDLENQALRNIINHGMMMR